MCRLTTLILLATISPAVFGQATATRPVDKSAAVQAVLRYIPDDAHLVLLVPSLRELTSGVNAFGRAVGSEELTDLTPLRVLRGTLGESAAALDPEGTLAVVLSAKWDDPLLIASLAEGHAWGELTAPTELRPGVRLYDFGAERFVAAEAGRVAIFARDKGELPRALDASGAVSRRLHAELGERLNRDQLLVFVDVPGWKDLIETRTAWLAQRFYVGMAAAGPDAELGMQLWNWMFERFKQAVMQVRTVVAGLRAEPTGVSAELRLEFQPDGSIARYLSEVRPPQRELLRGLPAQPGAMIVAFEWEEPPGSRSFNEELMRAMLATPSLKDKLGEEKLHVVVERAVEINRHVPGTSLVFGTSRDGTALLYWGLYLTSDGPKVRRELRQFCELTPELISVWGTLPAALKACPSEQVGNTEADVYELALGEAMSPVQPVMQAIYGADPRFYVAAHPEGLAYSFGPREEARRRLAELLAADAPLGADRRVSATLARLSPRPQGCLLLDPPAFVRAVLDMTRRLGMPMPRAQGGEQPSSLVGMALYLEPRALRVEAFVPAESVKATLKLVESLRGGGDAAQ